MTSRPTDDEQEQLFERQRTIWIGLYGPMRADELVTELRARAESDPDRPVADLVKELDPDDDDWEEGGLSRPGVG